MSIRKLLAITAMALSAATVAFASDADPAPLRIAHIDPLSGPMAAVGKSLLAQEQFDANRINAQGGAGGHQIEIVPMDNKLNPQQAVIQLQKAIDDGIHYVIQGNGSSVTSALLSAINKHNARNPDDRVLFLNRAAADPEFTNERCSFWHFRFAANADMIANLLTDWLVSQKNINSVFLVNPDYSFGHSVSETVRRMLKDKDPSMSVVGDVFVPLGKVKDYTPYVSQIKVSGADAVITGNWGQDMVLLVKGASDYGLKVPIVTYFGNATGTVSALGQKGVGQLYVVSDFSGDFDDPVLAKREEKMYSETGWDFTFLRITDMMEMLKLAVEKADSTDPTEVAYALEGMSYDSPTGRVTMRAEDHQIQMPMFVSVLQDHMKHGAEGTHLNFHAIAKFPASKGQLPTTCRMTRPERP